MLETVDSKGSNHGTPDMKSRACQPRLMNMRAAAQYIGVSYWTMRDYIADSILPSVILPSSRRRKKGGAIVRRAGDMDARRIYVDRADLDALVEKCKRHPDLNHYD